MAGILMKLPSSTPSLDQRVIQDRWSHPTPFISTLRFGGRRKSFRRREEGRNQYVDCLSLRTIVLTLIILVLSILDAIFTFVHLENGGSELTPLVAQIVQSSFQSVMIFKSLGVGLMGWFLAIHQNFKISFSGMHVLAVIHVVIIGVSFSV
jgi:hypothetical protein